MKTYNVYLVDGQIIKTKATDEHQAESNLTDEQYGIGIFMTTPGHENEFIFQTETGFWELNPLYYPTMEICGKNYGNFGSPNPIHFVNGTSIPGVEEKRAKELLPIFTEGVEYLNGDTGLLVDFNDRTQSHIDVWQEYYMCGKVDFVFVSMKVWLVMQLNSVAHRDNPFRLTSVTAERAALHKRYI